MHALLLNNIIFGAMASEQFTRKTHNQTHQLKDETEDSTDS